MAPAALRPLRRLADLLTLARAVIGLPLLLAMGGGQEALAWGLLLAGGLSDWADGVLARRAGGGSVWGARLDPLTDKILISAPLLALAARGVLPLWAVWLLLARELLVSGWRAGQVSGGPVRRAAAAALARFVAPGRPAAPRGLGAVLALAGPGPQLGLGLPAAWPSGGQQGSIAAQVR